MRKLSDCELYKNTYANSNELRTAISQQLSQNIGVIAPEHIPTALADLRTRSRNSYYAFLSEALALYEQRGLIRLFNLSNANGGRSRVPTLMPYFPAKARNRVKQGDTVNTNNPGMDNVLFVNMYRIGNWSADETAYNGLSALTDLYSCLESGVIGYKMSIGMMADKVFENKQVLEYLEKIYAYMFGLVAQKTKTTFGESDFQKDAANFLIARFFLLYVLRKTDSETVDDYAYLAIQNRSSLESLKSFEEINKISYDSLSSFLNTFGAAFYNGEGLNMASFNTMWVSCFGDATGFAIEYAPYLIHFLFAVMHGASLGGTLRLSRHADNLKKLGLPRLYNAVVSSLK